MFFSLCDYVPIELELVFSFEVKNTIFITPLNTHAKYTTSLSDSHPHTLGIITKKTSNNPKIKEF